MIVCATCGRAYRTARTFNGRGHATLCEKPVESPSRVAFDVVHLSGENEIGRERCWCEADQDSIDNAISEVLETWILAMGDTIQIVEVE